MLSFENSQLCQRETQLLGLDYLLDPDRLVDRLSASHLGRHPRIEIDYLRYKPGRRCIALFRVYPTAADNSVEAGTQSELLVGTAWTHDSWNKFVATGRAAIAQANRAILIEEKRLSFEWFPFDRELKSIAKLYDAQKRDRLLRNVLNTESLPSALALQQLAYKPGRRFVAAGTVDGQPAFTLKFYTRSGFPQARLRSQFATEWKLSSADLLAFDERYGTIATTWMSGDLLAEQMESPEFPESISSDVGSELGQWHTLGASLTHIPGLCTPQLAMTRDAPCQQLLETAKDIGVLCPSLSDLACDLAERITERIGALTPTCDLIHGDFYAKQVILTPGQGTRFKGVRFIDFDALCIGDRYEDVGNFLAKNYWASVLRHGNSECDSSRVEKHNEAFLSGYRQATGSLDHDRLNLQVAAGLLRTAPHAFRRALPDWPERTLELLQRAAAWLDRVAASSSHHGCRSGTIAVEACEEIAPQLDIDRVNLAWSEPHSQIDLCLQPCRVQSARLLRHKPSRRMLVEYSLATTGPSIETTVVLGKARLAKAADVRTFELHRRLSTELVSRTRVPRAMGIVPELQMWLQERIDGAPVTCGPETDVHVHSRVAQSLADLHSVEFSVDREHSIDLELEILERLLQCVIQECPEYSEKIETVRQYCREVSSFCPSTVPVLIHRDFYFDQVLVGNDSVYLLDLDLACMGPAELDVGNYLAHLDEHALRKPESAVYCEKAANRFLKSYLRERPQTNRKAITLWRDLALVRHIAISHRMDGRQHVTLPLIHRYFEYCRGFFGFR